MAHTDTILFLLLVTLVIGGGQASLRGGAVGGHDSPPKVPTTYTAKASMPGDPHQGPVNLEFTSNGAIGVMSASGGHGEIARLIDSTADLKIYKYVTESGKKVCADTGAPAEIAGKGVGMPHGINNCGQPGFECVKQGENRWILTVKKAYLGEDATFSYTFNGDRLVSMTRPGPHDEDPEEIPIHSFEEVADSSLMVIPEECRNAVAPTPLPKYSYAVAPRPVAPQILI